STGAPFPNNRIPVNPTSAKILDLLYPRQNQATGAAIRPNYVVNVPGAYTVNGFDVRGDQNLGTKQKVFVRYSHKNLDSTGTDGTAGYNTVNGIFSNNTEVRNLAGSYSFFFNPTLINEFRAGFSLSKFVTSYPLAAQGGDIIKQLGLTGLPPTPASGGIPNFNFSDGSFISTSPGRPRTVRNKTYQFTDNITWIRGRHTMKAGVDFQRLDYTDILTFFAGDEFG